MTFSIVGRSADAQQWGVAVASKFLAVGSAVPAARLDHGALATQALVNTLYKRDGLALLAQGRTAHETLAGLLEADEGREHRQVGVVDAHGGSATWTGSECWDWAGGLSGSDHAIQGNILTGPEVVGAMSAAWHAQSDDPLAVRLLAALRAGDAAGGDRRGRQSAALLVVSPTGAYTPGDEVAVDLRVDDHRDPVAELSRLFAIHELLFGIPDESTLLPLAGDLALEVTAHLARLGHADLDTWAGIENFERRLRPGLIDPLVLQILRAQAN